MNQKFQLRIIIIPKLILVDIELRKELSANNSVFPNSCMLLKIYRLSLLLLIH